MSDVASGPEATWWLRMRRHPGLFLPLLLPLSLAVAATLPVTATAAEPAKRAAAEAVLEEAEDLMAGRGEGELTLALGELHRRMGGLDAAGRAEARELLARPGDPTDEDEDGDAWYTVGEETPLCSEHFCVHYVAETENAPDGAVPGGPVPAYVERVAEVFEEVYAVENGDLGWEPPVPDDGLGGDDRLDVYLADVGEAGIYGYAGPDAGQPYAARSKHAYMVMDDDYEEFDREDDRSLKVTAAHEYNHVLQFGLQAKMGGWAFESTATWMEEQVYPDIDDYLQYVKRFAQMPGVPLTVSGDKGAPLFEYGASVWVHWFGSRHGSDAVRRVWEEAGTDDGLEAFSRVAGGGGFASDFADFAASLTEWRVPGQGFPDADVSDARWVDFERSDELAVDGQGVQVALDHASVVAFDVTGVGSGPVQLDGRLPDGTPGALVLVGRTGGDDGSGEVDKQVTRLPAGGAGTVTLPGAERFGRVTALFVNADREGTGPAVLAGAVSTPDAQQQQQPPPPPPTQHQAPSTAPVVVPGPTLAEVRSRVAQALGSAVAGFRRLSVRRLRRTALLRHPFALPADGSVRIVWRGRARRGRLAGRGPRVTLAKGTVTGRAGETPTVHVRLTKAGRRLLLRTRRAATVTVTGTFVGGPATAADPATASRRLRLRR